MAKTPGDSSKNKKVERPLSPHLTIYKPQISSVMSITHRVTGIFLILGMFVLSWWLIALAGSAEDYKCVADFITSLWGNILMIGWTFSIFYHLCNGIRYLFWDIGMGFNIKTASYSGWTAVVVTAALTTLAIYTAVAKLGGFGG